MAAYSAQASELAASKAQSTADVLALLERALGIVDSQHLPPMIGAKISEAIDAAELICTGFTLSTESEAGLE